MTILISFSLARIKERLQLSLSPPQEAFQFLRAKCHSRTSAAGRSWQRTARKNQFHLREPLQQPFAPLACNTFLNESDVPPIVPISNLRPRSLRNRGRRSVACPMILHTASTHIHWVFAQYMLCEEYNFIELEGGEGAGSRSRKSPDTCCQRARNSRDIGELRRHASASIVAGNKSSTATARLRREDLVLAHL